MIRSIGIPCDPGQDVVYGLAGGVGDEIYLAPSNEFTPGLCAEVYAFDTVREKFRQVIDLRRATGFEPAGGRMPHSKVHLCLKSTFTGRLFAATHFTAPAVGQTDFDPMAAYRRLYPGCFLVEYDPHRDEVINHGLLLRGEGARIACLDERHACFYFLSYPRCHLYQYDYDRRRLTDLGRLGQENAFGLEADDDGDVYTSDDRGAIVRYRRAPGRLEDTGLRLPQAPGRSPAGNYIRRMIRGLDGAFYGFTNKGARLFRFEPGGDRVEDFGVVYGWDRGPKAGYPNLPAPKALAQVTPGSLHVAFGGDGIYLDGIPVPNLVEFDLREGRARDLGKFIDGDDGTPTWIPQCALAQPGSGAIYFGMQRAVGELRLWKVDLSAASARRGEGAALLEAHVEAVRRQPFGASVEGSSPLPFVRRGHVIMHELGWPLEDREIPAGESAIADLLWHASGRIYGGTVGARPRLFSFRPHAQSRFTENYEVHPWDLGAIDPEPATCLRLFDDRARNRLLIAGQASGRSWVRAFRPGSEAARYRGVFHSLPHWPPVAWDGDPFPLLAEARRGESPFVDFAFAPGTGGVLGLRADGTSTPLLGEPMAAPRLLPGATCLAACPTDGRVAFGTRDGGIEVVSSSGERQRAWQFREPWPIRALAWHPDGSVYGFAGEESGIGEAFRADPVAGTLDEIGILQVSSHPRYWMCHRCDRLLVGPRGEVYFAEHDRISHLFVYLDQAPPC